MATSKNALAKNNVLGTKRQDNSLLNVENLNFILNVMTDEKERLLTFENGQWPVPFISKEQLANAGFFYLLNSDRVQCAFCRVVICAWEPEDVPLIEHKKHFPRCPFLIGNDVGNNPIGRDPIRADKRTLSRDVCGPGFLPSTKNTLKKINQLPVKSLCLEEFGVRLHKGAANVKYASFNARILSFKEKLFTKWSCHVMDIVEAGFFYTSIGEYTKCFYCDGAVNGWDKCQNPWVEHAIRFPECDFLSLNKGQNFINSCRKQFSEETTNFLSFREQKLADFIITQWLQQPIIESLLKVEFFSEEKLREILQIRWMRKHCPYDDLQELISDCKFHTEREKIQALANADEKICSESDKKITSSQKICPLLSSYENIHSESVLLSPISSVSLSTSVINTERLLCKTCLDQEVAVLFLPCAHLVTCTKCALCVNSCPVCRSAIKATVRVFLA